MGKASHMDFSPESRRRLNKIQVTKKKGRPHQWKSHALPSLAYSPNLVPGFGVIPGRRLIERRC